MTSRTRRICRVIAAAELPIVLVMSPALLFPSPARLSVLLVVPVVWVCSRCTTGRWIPSTPLNTALFVLLAMVVVSLYATFDVIFSLDKVSGVLLGVLLFWATVRWSTTRERFRIGTAAFLLAGGALAILGLLGTNWIDKFAMAAAVVRRLPKTLRGIPGAEQGFQPNAVAGILVLFVPVQAALVFSAVQGWFATRSSRNRKNGWLITTQTVLLTLTTGTLLLTQSRGAWGGLLVAALMFLAWHTRWTRTIALSVAASIALATWVLGAVRVLNLAIIQSGAGVAGDISSRLDLWSRALAGIHDFPLTGMGMNGFRRLLPILYPAAGMSPTVDVAHAHNHLLQAALDLGIPGLIAYVAIWIVIATILIAVYRQSPDRTDRIIAGGFGAGLIAHFVFSMTDAIALGAKVGVLLWITFALAVALHSVVTKELQSLLTAQTAPSANA